MINASVIFERVHEKKPLVHHITNWVTIYDCANVVRAFGALPVMAHAREESAEMASVANALVLNIGTLTPELVESMIAAGKKANEKGIPVVLDCVGAGATRLRTEKAGEILDKIKVDVIKGNLSEIATLAGVKAETKGVESVGAAGNAADIAKKLAIREKCTVVITGKEDFASNGKETFVCKNGHEMMGKVVGTGCMAASIIGAFCAVEKNYAIASIAALGCFGIAAEIAAGESKGPGSFKENLYDEIFNLNRAKIEKMQKVEEIS